MESWVVAGIVKRAVAEGNSTGLFDDSTPLYENLDPVYLYAGHVDGKRLACESFPNALGYLMLESRCFLNMGSL